jgi:hypothetical protein
VKKFLDFRISEILVKCGFKGIYIGLSFTDSGESKNYKENYFDVFFIMLKKEIIVTVPKRLRKYYVFPHCGVSTK